MKKLTILIVFVVSSLFLFASCKNQDDDDPIPTFTIPDPFEYTQEEIDNEQKIIEAYINDRSLNMTKTSSGLHYEIEKEGNGLTPDSTDTVITHYEGYNILTDTLADRSDRSNSLLGIPFRASNVIEGVKEGFLLTSEGSIIRLIIPSYLGYGKQYLTEEVPSESILEYTFEINKVVKDSI